MKFTLTELQKLQEERLKELIKVAGNAGHLSRMINTPFSTVQGWVNRGRISKQGAITVEEHPVLGEQFKAVYLRPDI